MAVAEAPYCAVTFDVEVQVAPMYLPDDSAPESGLHVFFYAMRLMNHSGAVKSPTYTLLEPYQTDQGEVFHFDLYRLKSPEELEFLGFDEIFEGPGFKFVEWPEQGAGWLPSANVEVSLSLHAPNQTTEEPIDFVAQMQRKVSVRFA